MLKRVTSGEARLHGLAPGQHSSEETSQWWRTFSRHCADLTGPGIETQSYRTDSMCATQLS